MSHCNLEATRKEVAIVQSNYLPWKGYFDLIDSVDEFVLLDTVQYTHADWRNRNRIKSNNGLVWLTIPVVRKGRTKMRVCDIQVEDSHWIEKHLARIYDCYRLADHFRQQIPWLRDLFETTPRRWLSEINRHFLVNICDRLGIATHIRQSMELDDGGQCKTARLVDICQQLGATRYISGPSAKAYLDEELFEKVGIGVTYFDYEGFVEYPQVHPPFEHAVSVIDAFLNVGEDVKSVVLRSKRGMPMKSKTENSN